MPSLTTHDLSILEKIQDPEAGPSAPLLIDCELPRDPHVADPVEYQTVTQRERDIIASIQAVEMGIAGLGELQSDRSPLEQYLECVARMDDLVRDFPKYASVRNNRAQALRRVYGDEILLKTTSQPSEKALVLDPSPSDSALSSASSTILNDLTAAISLLTPRTVFSPISPQAAKTLSQAYTQRGAIYHLTAKRASQAADLRIESGRRESTWTAVDFEENASRDFTLGGRYGNEIAKALAVSTNPTAKLCGEMVKEAMRKEYAGQPT